MRTGRFWGLIWGKCVIAKITMTCRALQREITEAGVIGRYVYSSVKVQKDDHSAENFNRRRCTFSRSIKRLRKEGEQVCGDQAVFAHVFAGNVAS